MMLSFISLDKVGGVWDGNACAGPICRHYGHMDPRKRDLISSIWGFQRGDVTIVVFLFFFMVRMFWFIVTVSFTVFHEFGLLVPYNSARRFCSTVTD
jgi:hypothetical protein